MNYIDMKYTNLLSVRLPRFAVKSTNPYKVNFRCPICGDSQTSKVKARGWILDKDNKAFFHCFNCNVSLTLKNFLKTVDINLYNDYIIDSKLELNTKHDIKSPIDTIVNKVPSFKKSESPLLKIKKISQLDIMHPAKKYIENRKIPTAKHYKLYYTPKFNAWVNTIIPDKLKENLDEPRLVLPFIDKDGTLFGFTGRSFKKDGLRYLTIMIDESKPKMFGLDDVNFDKKYYVVEGPIDSLFLDNSVAMAGADGSSDGLKNTDNAVFVFDNEPRNKEICNRMETMLDRGFKLCIWPDKLVDKDINDMILSGLNPQDIIDSNTYSGLQGKLQLSYWRKC